MDVRSNALRRCAIPLPRPTASAGRILHAAAVAGLVAGLATVARATDPSDLCTGNPCVVSGAHTIDSGEFLDFGDTTDLVFAGSAVVQVNDAAFRAGSITLEAGARLVGGGAYCAGVSLETAGGDIVLQENAGVLSRIELSGACAGSASLYTSPTGDVRIDGVIDTSAVGGYYNSGGSIGISSSGALSVRGRLAANGGGSTGGGGFVMLEANGGDVLVDATLEVASGVSGGVIEVLAYGGGDASVDGNVDIRGGLDSGGHLHFFSELGSASLEGTVLGTGTTGAGPYGCGGDPSVDFEVAGDVTIGAIVTLNGLGQYCPSGFMSIEAGGSVTQLEGSKISAVGLSRASAGGMFVQAGGDVVLRSVNMSSPDGGGSIDASTTGGAFQILGSVNLKGPGASASMSGCDVYVAKKGTIDTRGGGTFLGASETMTIVGKLVSNGNQLVVREGAPLLAGTISPPPLVGVNPGLPDCRPGPSCTPGGSCGDGVVQCGEECDDGPDNGTPASSCSTGCVETPPALRIPGGGSRPFDCPYEWSMALDPDDVLADPIGVPRNKQSCQDNDPSCDFEPAPGVCRLHLWSCLGGADARLACSAAQVGAVTILAPKATSTKPVEVAARAALEAALAALGVPVGPGEDCTPRYDVALGVGQKALKLKTKATIPGKIDGDLLDLSCTP
ncbi:MAG: hypothetical protein AB1689_13255 [Thermodesulfobacteriota bacterium]